MRKICRAWRYIGGLSSTSSSASWLFVSRSRLGLVAPSFPASSAFSVSFSSSSSSSSSPFAFASVESAVVLVVLSDFSATTVSSPSSDFTFCAFSLASRRASAAAFRFLALSSGSSQSSGTGYFEASRCFIISSMPPCWALMRVRWRTSAKGHTRQAQLRVDFHSGRDPHRSE